MTKLDVLNEIASAITGQTVKATDIKSAIDIIAAKGKGSAVSSKTIAEALAVCNQYIDEIISGGGGGGSSLHLYCYEARDASAEESDLYYFYTSKEVTADGDDYLFYANDGNSPFEGDYINSTSVRVGAQTTVYKNESDQWIAQAPFGGGAYDYILTRHSNYDTSLV